jgi:hypothetical protein
MTAIEKSATMVSSKYWPIQRRNLASLPYHEFPPAHRSKKDVFNLKYWSDVRTRTRVVQATISFDYSTIYFFQTRDKNRGPVKDMTVIYGRIHDRLYCCS